MAGIGGSRRQYILLGFLGALVVVYFAYGGTSVTVSGETIGDLPPIDIAAVMKGLKDVNTVKPEAIGPPPGENSVPDRNLFQYGEKTPPPPPPMTEAERKAEEDRLRVQEENLRKQQEEAAVAEAARVAAEAQAKALQAQALAPPVPADTTPPVPPPPPKPKPPEINFRFVGIIGSPQKKVAVFMNGDKMILARRGEIIDGKFRVMSIGVETAGIGYTNPDFKDITRTLDLGR